MNGRNRMVGCLRKRFRDLLNTISRTIKHHQSGLIIQLASHPTQPKQRIDQLLIIGQSVLDKHQNRRLPIHRSVLNQTSGRRPDQGLRYPGEAYRTRTRIALERPAIERRKIPIATRRGLDQPVATGPKAQIQVDRVRPIEPLEIDRIVPRPSSHYECF